MKLFVSATRDQSGKTKVFTVRELDAIMASACRTSLSQTVLLDGKASWEGGYNMGHRRASSSCAVPAKLRVGPTVDLETTWL